jgi:D-lactate dehydrogenase (cytochrome)
VSAPSPALIEALYDRFGDRFSTSQPLREQHGRGESHHIAAIPDAIVFAENTEDVAETVRLCAAEGVPVIAFGAGTSRAI